MEQEGTKQRLLPARPESAQNDSPSAPRLGSITGRSSWKLQAKRPPSGNTTEVHLHSASKGLITSGLILMVSEGECGWQPGVFVCRSHPLFGTETEVTTLKTLSVAWKAPLQAPVAGCPLQHQLRVLYVCTTSGKVLTKVLHCSDHYR